jgi:uncharacterized protein YndB with AHSA1/START domain
VVRAPREDVWAVLADPWHQPRWWPRTVRVEGVRRDGWTSVLTAQRSGRSIRADWRVEENQQPVQRRWAQEIEGTPFERILRSADLEIRLKDAEGGTAVSLATNERLRGVSRLGSPMMRQATRRRLDDALEGIERTLVP